MSDRRDANLIYGRNAVAEALKGGRTIERLYVQDGAQRTAGKIISLAKSRDIRIDYTSKKMLDRLTEGAAHQGLACRVSSYKYADINDILGGDSKSGLLVVLDGIEDPHNMGAIIRTAECAGADGVIIPSRRSSGLTEVVAKASAGAIEHMPCAKVGNIANTLDLLKEKGYWICGTDMDGDIFWDCDLKGKVAIVIGNEGKGMSRLVREKCDFIASIPMLGQIGSLNASNAAAILLYEAVKQRS